MVLHSFNWPHGGTDVKVTGDFDDWAATTSMQKTGDGHWVKVIDLPANTKVYYKFVIDGNWCVDGEALKEGSGAHENNYVLTGSPFTNSTSLPSAAIADHLPVLGHGASYVSSAGPASEAVQDVSALQKAEMETTLAEPSSASIPALIGLGGHVDEAHGSAPTSNTPATFKYDDSGPSPSNPIAVLNAPNLSVKEVYEEAVSSLPSTEEIKHEVEHAAEVAGGLLAAGLAAGAALFGLSTKSAESEASPITGHTVESVQSKTSDVTETSEIGATERSQVSQTDALEQTAVAAATSAATNAYQASGLSGLSGVGAPLSSLSRDGTVGYTSIGTAVNEKTGVVGTSKIVQGIHDADPKENTQTARLANTTATSLLENHENGAKVERISDHAVLAEVGIGGAAIGTAVVTDETVSNSKELAIPSQASEHLEHGDIPITDVTTSSPAARPIAVSVDSGLAPALPRGDLPAEPSVVTVQSTAVQAVTPVVLSAEPVTDTNTVAATKEPIPDPVLVQSPVTAQSTAVQAVTPVALSTESVTETNTMATTKEPITDPVAVQSPVHPATTATTSPDLSNSQPRTVASAVVAKASTTSVPSSPSKSAAQAAARKASSGGMRQTLRSEPPQSAHAGTAAATAAAQNGEGGKKKKTNLLKKMKSMFGGSRDKV